MEEKLVAILITTRILSILGSGHLTTSRQVAGGFIWYIVFAMYFPFKIQKKKKRSRSWIISDPVCSAQDLGDPALWLVRLWGHSLASHAHSGPLQQKPTSHTAKEPGSRSINGKLRPRRVHTTRLSHFKWQPIGLKIAQLLGRVETSKRIIFKL